MTDSSLISYITILGTNKFGTAGDILVFSTGTVVVQSPLLVQGPAGFSSILVDQLAVTGNSSLAKAVADDLVVLGSSVFGSAAADDLIVTGSSALGNSSSNVCMLNCAASFTGPVDLLGTSNLPNDAAVMGFQRKLGELPVTTGTVLGEVLFSGWDGAAQGPGAQIRSVYIVSTSDL